MIKLIICLALILATTVSANSLPFRKCLFPSGTTKSFEIKGCDALCQLKAGQNVSITVDFQTDLDDPVPTYSAQVSWDPEPGTTKYDVLNSYSNACPDTPCPIHSGVAQKLTFNTALHKSQYVSTVKNATLTLWVDGNGDVLCSEVSVDIIV